MSKALWQSFDLRQDPAAAHQDFKGVLFLGIQEEFQRLLFALQQVQPRAIEPAQVALQKLAIYFGLCAVQIDTIFVFTNSDII